MRSNGAMLPGKSGVLSQPETNKSDFTGVNPVPTRLLFVNVVHDPFSAPTRTFANVAGGVWTKAVRWAPRRSAPVKSAPLTSVPFRVAPGSCAPLKSHPANLPVSVAPFNVAPLRSCW